MFFLHKKIAVCLIAILLFALKSFEVSAGFGYVSDSNDIAWKIDTDTNTTIGAVDDSLTPFTRADVIKISPNDEFAYLLDLSDKAYKIDVTTNASVGIVTTTGFSTLNNPQNLSFTPDSQFVYIGCEDRLLFKVNIASNAIVAEVSNGSTPFYSRPSSVVIGSNGSFGYFYDGVNRNIYKFNTLTNIATEVVINGMGSFVGVTDLQITSDGSFLYAADRDSSVNGLWKIDVASNTVVNFISIPSFGLFYISITPDNKYIFVPCLTGSIYKVGIVSNTVLSTMTNPLGSFSFPNSIGITPGNQTGYLADELKVWEFDVVTNTVISEVTNSFGPFYYSNFLAVNNIPPTPPTPPTPPPVVVSAVCKKNTFLSQREYFITISWKKQTGLSPVQYKIYRDASFTQLAGTVNSCNPLTFTDHNRTLNQTYNYFISSVESDGTEILIGETSIECL